MNGELVLNEMGFEIGVFALRRVSLRIAPGEYFVLTGPNGSGKTVLLKLICGLYAASRGSVGLNGRRLDSLPPWLRAVGYVPQDGLLFPNRDVAGNVEFPLEVRSWPRSERRRRVEEVAELVGVTDLLSRKVDGLSGGERQRVCLARALVFQPELMLLDEPLSALDESAGAKLSDELHRIQRETGIPTLHVAHHPVEIARLADRVGFLEGGVLTEIITGAEFRRHCAS